MSDNVVSLRPAVYCVKIERFAESFWVLVEGEAFGTLWGTVNNELVTNRLKFGDPICFQRSEIIDEATKP